MPISCKKEKDRLLFFWNKSLIPGEKCGEIGKEIIASYLAGYSMEIRKLTFDDIKAINPEELCSDDSGVLSDLLGSIFRDLEESKDLGLEERYTYVIVHKGKVGSIITGSYQSGTQGFYLDITCTDKRKREVSGTNYFIGSYIILDLLQQGVLLKNIWGNMEDPDKLSDYHRRRNCTVEGNIFSCDIVDYLNGFFSRMEKFKW